MTAVGRAANAPKVFAANADGFRHYVRMGQPLGYGAPALCGRVREPDDPRARWTPLKRLAGDKVCNHCESIASRELAVIVFPTR